jgi:hypothetical protein
MTKLFSRTAAWAIVATVCISLTGCASAERRRADMLIGQWEMKTNMGGRSIAAVMTLSREDGQFVGVWESMGREMKMVDIEVDGNTLSFNRSMGGGMSLEFVGEFDGDEIKGTYSTPMGELTSTGHKSESE